MPGPTTTARGGRGGVDDILLVVPDIWHFGISAAEELWENGEGMDNGQWITTGRYQWSECF